MTNKQATILKSKIEKIKIPVPESWVKVAGLLKDKKISAIAYQKEIRGEWENRLKREIKSSR